jgi:hypothetical protein
MWTEEPPEGQTDRHDEEILRTCLKIIPRIIRKSFSRHRATFLREPLLLALRRVFAT